MQTSYYVCDLVLGVVLYDDIKNDVTRSEQSWNWVYEPDTYQTNYAASSNFVTNFAHVIHEYLTFAFL